ncbi:MAG: hypothetical protein HOP08_09910 [Cyclobacteriaceae bacterium]|nr:hypothetical protein [Cyclobacteriaceae bacterium]
MKSRIINVLIFLLLYSACATITSPNGGPKDLKPPKLVSSSPSNNQKNFLGETVILTFNEYIRLNNPKEEIIISPSAGKEVEIKMRKNEVSIKPKDGWKGETTYSIQFREGIKDASEGNAPLNLKLAFSTGDIIDSLKLSGKVFDLPKGIAAEKITVAIFEADTFDIFSDSPSYFTKTDKAGNFSLENIKEGVYKIYAFDDKNKNLKVESRAERYGFVADKIDLKHNTDSLDMGLVMMDSRPLKINSIRSLGIKSRLRFNKFITGYKIEGDSNTINSFGDDQAEVLFWNPPTLGDSIKLRITAIDSLSNVTDSIFYIKKTPNQPNNDAFKWSTSDPTLESETGKFKAIMNFNKPITTINFDSVYIERDTVNVIPITKEDITIDNQKKTLTIEKELDKKLFKAEKDPVFILKTGKGFVYTIENDTSKATSRPVYTLWPEDSGIVLVEVTTSEKDFIIQLVSSDGKIAASVRNLKTFSFKNINPTEYQLRAIVDTNKNGTWDPGNIFKGIEPERVIYYKNSEGARSFPLRANWDVGPLILRF